MMPNGNQPSPDCAISSPLQSTASIFRTSPCNPKSGAVDHRPYGPYGAISERGAFGPAALRSGRAAHATGQPQGFSRRANDRLCRRAHLGFMAKETGLP